jgi:hypothetical protein
VREPSHGPRVPQLHAAQGKHGLFTFAVRWSRHFPNHGPGNYRVRFRLPGASAFGDPLTFRRG